MKLKMILTHPALLLCVYSLILISGEHIGGPYLMYIMMALQVGASHSLLAIAGGIVIAFTYARFSGRSRNVWEPLLNVTGVGLLYISLVLFFINSKGYNDGTLHQIVPLASLALFVLLSLLYVTASIALFAKDKGATRVVAL